MPPSTVAVNVPETERFTAVAFPVNAELLASALLEIDANRMASVYVDEPEDFTAAVTALISRTLELHLNRPINLENLYK